MKKRTSKLFAVKNPFLLFFVAFISSIALVIILPKKIAQGQVDSISYYALPEWNRSTLYRQGDYVQFQGGFYESLHDNIDHQPNLNLGFLWQVLPNLNQTTPLNILEPVAPLRLFDITLLIDSAIVSKSTDLLATISFTSFGTVPTPVSLDYKIIDSNGQVVYTEQSTIVVETERVELKEFPNLYLRDGIYSLVLTTNYADNVRDEFRQTFEVRGLPYYLTNLLIFLASIGVIGYIVYLYTQGRSKKTITRIVTK